MTAKRERILVIRLGALGDLVLCFQAFAAIRAAHPDAEIALLTMPAFAGFARSMPWFDQILIDERAPAWRLDQWVQLVMQVREFAPTRVYDLQGKRRQSILFTALGGPLGPQWSGAAPLCSHPRLWPPVAGMHFTDFVAAQLDRAQVKLPPVVDLPWLDAPLDEFVLPKKFVMLIPSCAAGREFKRWPAGHYADLANRLHAEGIATIAIGTAADRPAIAAIQAAAPQVQDFSGRTGLLQLAGIMRRSMGVVGNDTGPTHMAAALGAPTLALMSDRVNPVWSVPKGPKTQWLQGKPLADLPVDKVLLALQGLLDKNG